MPDSTQIDLSKYPDADLADTAAAGPTPAAASPADLQGSAAAALQVMSGLQDLLCCHATVCRRCRPLKLRRQSCVDRQSLTRPPVGKMPSAVIRWARGQSKHRLLVGRRCSEIFLY